MDTLGYIFIIKSHPLSSTFFFGEDFVVWIKNPNFTPPLWEASLEVCSDNDKNKKKKQIVSDLSELILFSKIKFHFLQFYFTVCSLPNTTLS